MLQVMRFAKLNKLPSLLSPPPPPPSKMLEKNKPPGWLNRGFTVILAVFDITTTVAPLTHRWQRWKKTKCLLHFRVLNLKTFSLSPAMMVSQEQTMMNSR